MDIDAVAAVACNAAMKVLDCEKPCWDRKRGDLMDVQLLPHSLLLLLMLLLPPLNAATATETRDIKD